MLTSRRSSLLIAAAGAVFFSASASLALGYKNQEGDISCKRFYNDLEKAIDDAGIRDASAFAVAGYPFLRTTRFLAEMKYFVTERREWEQLVDLMYSEGMGAIIKEVQNLPDQAVRKLYAHRAENEGSAPDTPAEIREHVIRAAKSCAQEPLTRLKQAHRLRWLSWPKYKIKTEYRLTRKILGLYPLWTLPIGTAIADYKRKISRTYGTPVELLVPEGEIRRFSPDLSVASHGSGLRETALLREASRNPLGIPLLTGEQLARLAQRYAPVLEQDVTGDYDLPGAVLWGGSWISVDAKTPVVYYYATHAILQGRPLLQLNYVAWYTERPLTGPLDISAGRIHGLTLRITLAEEGVPVMVDAIHNCGCYHFFFPDTAVFKAPRTGLLREDAFVPQKLPPSSPDARLVVRIGSKRHLVERLQYERGHVKPHEAYRLVPYEHLESLPGDSVRRASIFSPLGIVRGKTERLERFFLFSTGIPYIGSMRQRGHHGTALVGQRVFDDPRLFEKYFFLR
jgi:hypothetical protein